jgi:ribonuclease R
MDRDRVVARIEKWGKREGRIVRVLSRAQTKVVGRLDLHGPGIFVKPKNSSLPFDLSVAPGNKGKAKHGDTVVAEILSFPTDKRPPTAKIIKVLKEPDSPIAEIEVLLDEFNLPRRFSKKVIDEAKMLHGTSQAPLSMRGGRKGGGTRRKDLRNLATVTIDGEQTKDCEEAVSVSLTENGYRLWVHIADVGFYVPWDSSLDLEARKRGTSVYLPDRVVPMLPKVLSEDLCSLRPERDRYSFTVEMDFNRQGRRMNTAFYPSVIKSDERMTYTLVKKILIDQDMQARERYAYLMKDFEIMGELCSILRENRLERGSLDFDLPEPEVILDIQGKPEAILKAERNFAHIIIEEFMIAANEAVAEYLEQNKMPGIYRVHEEPDPVKLEEVFRVVKRSGTFARKKMKPKDFSDLLVLIKGTAEEEVITYLILRSLKQARYATMNVGHFGLASECYTHFTSPIRRYPDLVIHRLLRELLNRKRLSDKRFRELESILPDIAFSSSQMERNADKVEREAVDMMRVWFMRDKVGNTFSAKIVGITPYGIKVRLGDYYVEGFIPVSSMTDDFYHYNDKTLLLSGRNSRRTFRIGQQLSVTIDRIDMEERAVIFVIDMNT